MTSSAIAEAVRVATNGDYSADLPKLNLPQRQVPIVVRFSPETRTKLDDIKNMRVAGTNGNVDLGSIADIRIGGSPSEIDRIDRMRNVTLSVELNGRILGDVNREAQALPALRRLPPGSPLSNRANFSAVRSCSRALALQWRSVCSASTQSSSCCSTTSCSR